MNTTISLQHDFKLGRYLQLGNFSCTIEKLIYSGQFSQVFAISIPTLKSKFVLKISKENRFILREVNALRTLGDAHGFPGLFFAGQTEDCSFTVMNLLGRSLQTYLDSFRMFSIDTSLKIAQQTLERLRVLHDLGILHRDIKPDNFVVGNPDSHIIYMIDFGFSRLFRNKDRTIKALRQNGPLVGTEFYGSLAANIARDQGPKDDLESWLYMIMHLSTSSLPWSGMSREHVIDYKVSLHQKPELLRGRYSAFKELFKLILKTDIQGEPDYSAIQSLLSELMEENDVNGNEKINWTNERFQEIDVIRKKTLYSIN